MLESGVWKNKLGGVSCSFFCKNIINKRKYDMKDCNLKDVSTPVQKITDVVDK